MDKPSPVSTVSFPTLRLNSRRLTMTLYVVIVFLYWMALYLYVPILPTYIQGKVNDLAWVGIILAMYGLWQAIIRLPLGITADWLGRRKPFIVVCLVLVGLGAWLMGSADGAAQLLLGRMVTGLGAAAWVVLTVAFSSLFPPAEAVRATAMLTFVSSSGRVSATALTGPITQWGGSTMPFYVATAIAGVAVVLALLAHESRRPSVQPSLQTTGRLVIRRDVLLPAILAALSQYVEYTTIFGFIPILAEELGGGAIAVSMLVSLHLGMNLLGNLTASLLVNRMGAQRLVYMSFGVMAVAVGAAALTPTLALLFVIQFFMGLTQGINYPVLMGLSIRYVGEAERTTAMGLHQAVYAIGMFAGPWLSGMLANAIGLRPMLGVTAAACLILGWLLTSRLVKQ